jgi:recombination protein RecT
MARGSNGGGTTVEKAPAPSPDREKVNAFLARYQDRIGAALPRHLTPERMMQVVSMLTFRTPKLADCDRGSLIASVIQASALGLDLTPSLCEAYLIPRWNKNARVLECQFQPGYQGLTKLARQSGEVAFIQANLVRAGDEFQVFYDPELRFVHRPHFGADSGPATHVYGRARLRSGDWLIEVMTAAEVEAIRGRSQAADSGPWVTDWNEMAKKTVIKRLCKALPRSTELAEAIDADNADYALEAPSRARPAGRALGNAGVLAALGAPDEEPAFAEGTSGQITTEADEQAFEDAIERGEA